MKDLIKHHKISEAAKGRRGSYRSLAKMLKYKTDSFYVEVKGGKKNLGMKSALRIAKVLNFNEKEVSHFFMLLAKNDYKYWGKL